MPDYETKGIGGLNAKQRRDGFDKASDRVGDKNEALIVITEMADGLADGDFPGSIRRMGDTIMAGVSNHENMPRMFKVNQDLRANRD